MTLRATFTRLGTLLSAALLGACASTHGLAPRESLTGAGQLSSARTLAEAPTQATAWPIER
jgi:hypothetical protein